jgi:hypothetical protein
LKAARTQPVAVTEITALLAPAVGKKAAEDAIKQAASALGLPPDEWQAEHALSILDHLAARPGLLGISARFAKSRAILTFRDR